MGESAQRRSARLTLPAKATSPARARRFVSGTLAAWHAEGGEDAVLLVSELVTNALLHARTAMTVHLAEDEPGVVRLSVSDGSAGTLQERRFSLDSGTGRGLRLLGSLALEWGVEPQGAGKTVWCRIALAASEGAESYREFDIDALEAL